MLTDEQGRVHDELIKWYDENISTNNHTTVGGCAGTGKTFLISQLRKTIKENYKYIDVAFVTFTGKSSSVLKSRLEEGNCIYNSDHVGTIHSLIYKVKTRYDKETKKFIIVGWQLKSLNELGYDLIIIDEASMVSEFMWNDLKKFNKPIIAIGDHEQLPPIGGNEKFSLLRKPDFILNEIHRQAENSPIIRLSKFIRKHGYIPENTVFSKSVFKIDWRINKCKELWENLEFDDSLISLCGFNASRTALNKMIRDKYNFIKNFPYPGERIICLKNNLDTRIMNGQIGTLQWLMPCEKKFHKMTIQIDNSSEAYETLVSNECFGKQSYENLYDKDIKKRKHLVIVAKKHGFNSIDFFDYGYAISVHKSQGSEWNRVVLFEQRSGYWDDDYYKRWLYTAVTRAKEKLFIISNFNL